MYYNLNHQSYLIFMKLEFRPYLRTMDLNKDDWRIKIKASSVSAWKNIVPLIDATVGIVSMVEHIYANQD